MRFKIILLLIVSFLFNQSLLNRALGEQQLFGDARSYSMGFTHSINANNSSLIRHNPSLIGLVAKNWSIDFQMNNSLIRIQSRYWIYFIKTVTSNSRIGFTSSMKPTV